MALRNRHFCDNLKGITLKLFCTHENIPNVSAIDIVKLFQHSRINRDTITEQYFMVFYLNHFFHHDYFNDVLRFLQQDLYISSIDGLRFFFRQEYNPHDKILFIGIKVETFLYYLMSLF